MDKNKAISYFEKVIRDTDQVLPHCSEALRAELLEQRGYYELALEALRTPQRTEDRELAGALAWAGQGDTPPWAGLIRKRFEQVR